jgi:hypothetical protein
VTTFAIDQHLNWPNGFDGHSETGHHSGPESMRATRRNIDLMIHEGHGG